MSDTFAIQPLDPQKFVSRKENERYSVRAARMDELLHLVQLGHRMQQESPTFRNMDYDYMKVAEMGAAAIHDSDRLFLRVIVNSDDVAVGMLLCELQDSYFGKDKVAMDRLLVLEPLHRGHCMRQIQQVIGEYKDWARSNGAKLVMLATTTGIESDKTKMLFEYLDFAQIGTVHRAL